MSSLGRICSPPGVAWVFEREQLSHIPAGPFWLGGARGLCAVARVLIGLAELGLGKLRAWRSLGHGKGQPASE